MINIKHLTFSQDMINIKKYVSQRVVIVVVVLMVVLKDFSRYVGLRDLQQDFERQKWACALLDIGPLGGGRGEGVQQKLGPCHYFFQPIPLFHFLTPLI